MMAERARTLVLDCGEQVIANQANSTVSKSTFTAILDREDNARVALCH
jgi:hypothetical protein